MSAELIANLYDKRPAFPHSYFRSARCMCPPVYSRDYHFAASVDPFDSPKNSQRIPAQRPAAMLLQEIPKKSSFFACFVDYGATMRL